MKSIAKSLGSCFKSLSKKAGAEMKPAENTTVSKEAEATKVAEDQLKIAKVSLMGKSFKTLASKVAKEKDINVLMSNFDKMANSLLNSKTATTVEQFEQKLVDQTSDLIVDEIFESNPSEEVKPAEDKDSIGEPVTTEGDNKEIKKLVEDEVKDQVSELETESEDIYGTPAVSVTSSVKPAENKTATTKEGEAGAPESSETGKPPVVTDETEVPSENWDLFPEDNIARTVEEVNNDLKKQTKQAIESISGYVKKEGDSEFFSESDKMSLAYKVAQDLMETGINETPTLESESKRLFLKDTAELRATATVVSRLKTSMAKKVAYKHPDSGNPDILKVAISAAGQGEEAEENIFMD